MTDSVRIIEVPSQTVVSVRRRVALDELPAFLGQAFGRLSEAIPERAVDPGEPPFVIYHEVAHDAFDAEVCRPVAAPLDVPPDLASRELPGGPVATTLHVGSYDRLSDTYAAVQDWMAGHGATPAGPPRERYLVGPADTDRPSEYRTVVEIPCQVALVAIG